MRIGIDARMLHFTGIGRHISNLVSLVPALDTANEYVIFLRAEDIAGFDDSAANVTKVATISTYYDLVEQTTHLGVLNAAKLDLLHVPHFNIPIRYRSRLIVTIHDLIQAKLPSEKTAKAEIKRLGYRFVIGQALRKAERIIAVSNFTKQDIVQTFGTNPSRIQVIHNGVDTRFVKKNFPRTLIASTLDKYGVKQPYLLYVGLSSPHKNLARLIEALAKQDEVRARRAVPQLDDTTVIPASSAGKPDADSGSRAEHPHLVLAGKLDPRYTPELERLTHELGLTDRVHFTGFVPDEELEVLYNAAAAFVFPSLYEGFGIPPLEALACGTKIISSNAASLPEVLGDQATYFDPQDVNDMAAKIALVLDSEVQLGTNRLTDSLSPLPFNWNKMAEETVRAYQEALN